MKYKIRISEMRYGEVIVASGSSETAQKDADMNRINWIGHKTTDVTVESCYQPGFDHTAVEVCTHCESEIEMCWDVSIRGFKAYCPVCGKRLMLCDECKHSGKGDWFTGIMRKVWMRMYMKVTNVQRKV